MSAVLVVLFAEKEGGAVHAGGEGAEETCVSGADAMIGIGNGKGAGGPEETGCPGT